MLTAATAGFVTGLGLIVAIGAQNAFVLRQGLLRSHVLPVVLVCALSDALLIMAGVGGLGALVAQSPWVVTAARWFGAAFLTWYGVRALRQALRPKGLDAANGGTALETRRATIGRAFALTWLNPHVYLDTVLLLGSVAATHSGGRWWFAAGAVAGSVLWFSGLGFGARKAAPLVARPSAWRVIDLVTATTMLAVAVSLVLG